MFSVVTPFCNTNTEEAKTDSYLGLTGQQAYPHWTQVFPNTEKHYQNKVLNKQTNKLSDKKSGWYQRYASKNFLLVSTCKLIYTQAPALQTFQTPISHSHTDTHTETERHKDRQTDTYTHELMSQNICMTAGQTHLFIFWLFLRYYSKGTIL